MAQAAAFIWGEPPGLVPGKFDALKGRMVAERIKKPFGKKPKTVRQMKDILMAAELAGTENILQSLYDDFVECSTELKKIDDKPVMGSRKEGLLALGFVGFAAEAGESLDLYKKVVFHDNTHMSKMSAKRRDDLIKELGDAEWYRSHILRQLGITRREIMMKNMRKLIAREEGSGQ